MSDGDPRPAVWIGHVGLYSPEVPATIDFMLAIGMREVVRGEDFAVLEMRGGTHLVVTGDPESSLLRGSFDLMVDDIDAAHGRFRELGFDPGEIERGEIHDSFEMREPGGTRILFNSSHVGDLPV